MDVLASQLNAAYEEWRSKQIARGNIGKVDKQDFAEFLGMKPSTLAGIMNGTRQAGEDVIGNHLAPKLGKEAYPLAGRLPPDVVAAMSKDHSFMQNVLLVLSASDEELTRWAQEYLRTHPDVAAKRARARSAFSIANSEA